MTAGHIYTVAGNGTGGAGWTWVVGYTGDGGSATGAEISYYSGSVAVDSSGNLFFADTNNNVIREVAR